MSVLFICACCVLVAVATADYSFLTLGDWGGAAISAQDKQNVYAVADQMAKTATDLNPAFIVNTGDNFYWCGIQNTSDSQIQTDFELPYGTQDSLADLDWYSVLGNHEYGYNVQAQIDYSMNNSHWIMPDRYYTKRIEASSEKGVHISFIMLDTSPCVAQYREDDPANWDPCNVDYPTCSLSATDDDFEGSCNFHENIMTQSCDTQWKWFQESLDAVPAGDWLVVIGHHPIDEVNVFDFTSRLQNREGGFSIYLNGHAHTLTQYMIDGKGAYVTSGAGSLVDTPDQMNEITRKKVLGEKEITVDGSIGLLTHSDADTNTDTDKERKLGDSKYNNHTYQTVFNLKVAGFTSHTFNSDFTQLTTNFISYDGENIHSFAVYKDGTFV